MKIKKLREEFKIEGKNYKEWHEIGKQLDAEVSDLSKRLKLDPNNKELKNELKKKKEDRFQAWDNKIVCYNNDKL